MTASTPAKHLIVERLLGAMSGWDASDLYLTAGSPPAVRIHGTVVRVDMEATEEDELKAFIEHSVRADLREEFAERGDLDVGFSLKGGRRFRINLFREMGRTALVARALPSGDLPFSDLGLPEAVRKLSGERRGLVLVTGATGSGKSTTLAAMIGHINRTRDVHVVTIEDPIEFVHEDNRARISQREVGADTKSFQVALRQVVRQSPDVIMIGELRDMETMQVAISAALTGHLVLATLHTIDASRTIQRMLSYFPEHLREQVSLELSHSLRGIISQRLVPTKERDARRLALEVLTVTPPAARLIREQRVDELTDMMGASRDPDTFTFTDSLVALYREGAISADVGRAFSSNAEAFSLAARGMSTGVASFRGAGSGDGRDRLDLRAMLQVALERGASDLHLTVGRPPTIRVAGDLEPLDSIELTDADVRLLLYSILNVRQRTIYELEREIDFALSVSTGQRFRVNAYFQRGHMAAALRMIPSKVPDAEELGLPDVVLRLGDRPHGLLVVVGPTGSGKTTTLACLLDRINRARACHIITIEDPIEYTHESDVATVEQREVHEDTKSFSAALKYVLRQDPDVILVGEMRDLETISAALTAAETGHLVLATLHTNDAIQTIDRIIDVFPAHQQSQVRTQLGASLLGVISQRLLPRADGRGRVGVFETMVATPAIRTLIRDGKMHQALSVMESSRGEGMFTMDQALKMAVESGSIRHRDAMRYVRNPQSLGAPPPGES